MQFSLHRWIRVSLFNLLLLAFVGIILRYKIAFSLPFIDQKHLLHGHSHFAFSGWITQAIMVLLVGWLKSLTDNLTIKRYQWILWANLITAYGMLISFPIEGYGKFSILFSILSIGVSYVFAIMYCNDLNKLQTKEVSHAWFKVALLFNVISSIGVYALTAMMISRNIHQTWYLAAEYFYLHFQYNGWFFFACMGLFTWKIKPVMSQPVSKKIFWIFTCAFIPAYFLSVLWFHFPLPIYVLIVIAAVAQVTGWVWILQVLKKNGPYFTQHFSFTARWLMALSAIALSIKFLLQLGSVIPALSDLSYGFRPIIIGYLHLVLLGVITLFILGFMVTENYITISNTAKAGLIIFATGIIINEIFLMTQGVMAMSYNTFPFINELLFFTALMMFSGLIFLNISQRSIK